MLPGLSFRWSLLARLPRRGLTGIVALLLISVTTEVRGQSGVLPRDLAAIADSVACDPVPDFYSRFGPITAPFVYGVEGGEPAESAAFWCLGRSGRDYRLVILGHSQPTRIFSWWNPPAGLSVVEVEDVQLSDFRALDDPQALGPTHRIARSRAIKDEYGGACTLFLKWSGRWYFRVFD